MSIYARITFQDLHERLCDALCGNRSPVSMELSLPDGTCQILRQQKPPGDPSIG